MDGRSIKPGCLSADGGGDHPNAPTKGDFMTLSRTLTSFRSMAITAAVALALIVLIRPAAAQAGPLVASAPDCAAQDTGKVFLPWADLADYQFAPDGGFEDGAAGWTLSGSAGVVAGNESHYVHAADDSKSLNVPMGASATSPTVCVGLEHPTLRFFAKKSSGLLATMAVEVLFQDAFGNVLFAPIGVVAGTGSWQPTLPMTVIANLLPLLPGDHTPVRFRFTTVTGGIQIDDTYVDPYRGR